MAANLPRHIVIVGGGTAGWMAANLIAHQLGRFGVAISLIESPQINTVGVGEGSTPYLKAFFDQLGIEESQWMAECNASYKCGISFPGWSTVEGHSSYFHPFYGDNDAAQARPFFSNCDLRRQGIEAPVLPDEYFVCGILAKLQKAPHQSTSDATQISYGYHFDAALLGQYLKQHAIGLGVRHLEATINQIHQDGKGNIAIVQTAEFGPLRGDFFVDCSGFNGLLIRQTLGATIKSYKSRLFNDSAVAIQTPLSACDFKSQSLSSETVSKAISHGWVWHIPLQNRMGNGYVYDSNYISKEQAESQLRQLLGDAAKGHKALHLHWHPGRLENHWLNNCVAIGLSQGFLEPLEAPMLFIIQRSIEQFIALLLDGGNNYDDKRQAFDTTINNIIDGTVDYLQGHYKLNSRSDSQYWHDARNNTDMSQTLSQLLDGWKAGIDFDALLHLHHEKLAYLKTSWYCMLAGKGYFNDITQAGSDTAQQTYVQAKNEAGKQAADFYDHWHYLTQILPLQAHS